MVGLRDQRTQRGRMSDIESLIKTIKKTKDLYDILGVEKDADEVKLKSAYRKLALKLHPDKCTLDGGDDAFKKVRAVCSFAISFAAQHVRFMFTMVP